MRVRRSRRWNRLILALLLLLVPMLPALALAYDDDDDDDDDDEGPSYEIHGFVEAAGGGRVVTDPATPDEMLLGEARFRLEAMAENDLGRLSFKGDFLADAIDGDVSVDIRDASVYFRLGSHLDVRAGRQVLTWGTGDLLFINDLFSKDWVSFFVGREDEYLKAPSTALKVGIYSQWINLDLVWTPVFAPDRFITGKRVTFFDPLSAGMVNGQGQDVIDPRYPDKKFRYGEFASRMYGSLGSFELALYGYMGFWKQPLGIEMGANEDGTPLPQFNFPRLGVYGASVRGPLLGGIVNAEGAFYHSIDDASGDDPFVPNHQARGLVGYEHELISKMTLGAQYYLEFITQHGTLMDASPIPQFEQEELRHVLTLRWTYMLLRDDLMLSMFAFFSPSEMDAYIRPVVSYKINDAIRVAVGSNIVVGKDDHTFFGRLSNNTNVYGRIRYTF